MGGTATQLYVAGHRRSGRPGVLAVCGSLSTGVRLDPLSEGHRNYPSERGGSLRVHHIRHIGFGVSSVSALRYGDPIDGLWGQLFELAPEDTALLETMDTVTKTAKVSGENSKVEFAGDPPRLHHAFTPDL